ncbi:hypothetical protein V8E53_006938 [Lactarius tabidus]
MAHHLPGLQNEPDPGLPERSAPLFSMYNKIVKEHDEKMIENWNGNADSILVFTGLLSAVVALLLGSVLQNLRPNPQNASSFYLAHMYQLTPGSNVSNIPFDDPATFKPPTSAILVSTLWSLSLVVSLTCALLASLLQQWARRYRHITPKENDPQKRAQTRELMAQALNKVPLSWLIKCEPLPFLLHTSIFMFLAGFVVHLFTFNNLVAELAGACAGISLLSYLYVSLTPIYSRASPFYTPITTLVWATTMGIISLFHRLHYFVASRSTRFHPKDLDRIWETFQFYYERMLSGTPKDVETRTMADAPSSGLATSVLLSTFDSLDGVSDLEQFLSYIPGFYESTSAQEHVDGTTFEDFNSDRLPSKISLFMEHVLLAKLSDYEKTIHIEMCSNAINANTSLLRSTFELTLQTPDSKVFDYHCFVNLALEQSRRIDADSSMKDYAQCVMAIALSRVQDKLDADDLHMWIDIIIQRYLKNDDRYPQNVQDLRLCSLIYLTQHLKDSQLAISNQFEAGKFWHNILASVVRNVEPRGVTRGPWLKFLKLWDELAPLAHNSPTDQERQNTVYVIDLLGTVNANLRANPVYES